MVIERGRRYPSLEQEFVERVCARAEAAVSLREGVAAEMAVHFRSRLDKGAEEYGKGQFWQVPFVGPPHDGAKALVSELQEEAVDLLGWGSLLAIRLRERGWRDIESAVEDASVLAVEYGNALEAIREQIEARLAGG